MRTPTILLFLSVAGGIGALLRFVKRRWESPEGGLWFSVIFRPANLEQFQIFQIGVS